MRLLFLIPVYNHPYKLRLVANACLKHDADVLFVDDGSNELTQNNLRQVCEISDRIFHIRLAQNCGKGSACLHGMRWGIEQGYSHVFQIDADAQQDLTRIQAFIDAAIANPKHIICGYPIYNESVPLARKWGRYLTHFWVDVNTLSFAIKDSLCGFRIYPLNAVAQWLSTSPLIGLRMDFDPDIIVQLYRQGTNVINLPVGVNYPADGISHFRASDHWLLSKMHARNCISMLLNFPRLISRHFQ